MTDEQIDEAIDSLKTICDERGHELLEAIRRTWKRYETLVALIDMPDNDSHSRNAESRVAVNPRLRIVP